MIIFYDGQCALCSREMNSLKKHDTNNRITLVDVHSDFFERHYGHLNKQSTLDILHGIDNDGTLLLGLDVTCRVWHLVGKFKWLQYLRKPPIKWVADKAYLLFAKHRVRLSTWLFPNQCDHPGCKGQ
ncbi:DUF393 domain-containing protein [Pseudoalteromonas sp. MMG005]|uniref:thiol-disulfide oxidoreductase DCC family protein n=1 Tax=Pseudoalteromonas sp. MMG005 TaxID=2822682 RepID=UPI001B39D5AE|nr:DUF393 domain-containing protein [Pseudoalteromonas sp. MMG005]MBQ4847264.1 DUF393 domain-containing protein [Pseudoalteromonas sp. MMG005]